LILFPQLAGVTVERGWLAGRSVRIQARADAGGVACPRVVSRQVHSRYERRLADTPVSGPEVLIQLQVRRYFCRNPAG